MEAPALRSQLITLSEQQQRVTRLGGPEADGALFEHYLAARTALLTRFGLPETASTVALLDAEDVLTPERADAKLAQLHRAATAYLTSEVQRAQELLANAQELGHSPFEVLPMLGIAPHVYTLFVWDEILMKRLDLVDNIWAALKQVNNSVTLDHLGQLYDATDEVISTLLPPLQAACIPYLEVYMHWNEVERFNFAGGFFLASNATV